MAKCAVCGEGEGKYRCKCAARVPFCSPTCYRAHCAGGCLAAEEERERAAGRERALQLERERVDAARRAGPAPVVGAVDEVRVTDAQLEALARCAAVRDALAGSAELRAAVAEVDSAPCGAAELERRLGESAALRAFTNEVLRAIGHESGAMSVPPSAAERALEIEAALAEAYERTR